MAKLKKLFTHAERRRAKQTQLAQWRFDAAQNMIAQKSADHVNVMQTFDGSLKSESYINNMSSILHVQQFGELMLKFLIPDGHEEHLSEQSSLMIANLPKFHKEYFEEFPDHETNQEIREFLEALFFQVQNSPLKEHDMKPDSFDVNLYLERWGSSIFSQKEELDEFITKSKPGDIFKNRSPMPYGTTVKMAKDNFQFDQKQTYQCIRNVENQYQMAMQPGKNYVQINFVDLSHLLWSIIYNHLDIQGSIKIYHIDMNVICVARSLIIHKMLLQGMNTKSIFEVWYSSCLSQKSVSDLRAAITMLLSEQSQDDKVKELLSHWLAVISSSQQLTIQKAFKAWYFTQSGVDFNAVGSLTNRNSRVQYTRYLLTGTFGQSKDYVMGNPTYFSLPPSYKDFSHLKDNLFNSIPKQNIIDLSSTMDANGNQILQEQSTDIIQQILDMIYDHLKILAKRIQKKQYICYFQIGKISLDNHDMIEFIENLDPYQIDWSNMCDYMTNKDFLDLAFSVSSEDTAHTCHMLNWIQYVKGMCLLDHGSDMQNQYNTCWKLMEKVFLKALSRISGIRNDYIIDHPINKYRKVAMKMFIDGFLKWYFGLRDIEPTILENEQSYILYSIFGNNNVVVPLVFTFKENLYFDKNKF